MWLFHENAGSLAKMPQQLQTGSPHSGRSFASIMKTGNGGKWDAQPSANPRPRSNLVIGLSPKHFLPTSSFDTSAA
jgi:hypothetical protein